MRERFTQKNSGIERERERERDRVCLMRCQVLTENVFLPIEFRNLLFKNSHLLSGLSLAAGQRFQSRPLRKELRDE